MGDLLTWFAAKRGDRPTQFVATGGVVPYNNPGTAATGTSTTRQDRTRHRVGAGGFREMAVVWGNYYVTSSNVETALGAVTDFQASITMNGITKRLTFSGSNSTTMTAGQAMLTSDLVKPSDFGLSPATTAGVHFYVFARITVANGSTYRVGSHYGSTTQPSGEPANSIGGMLSGDANNQVMAGTVLNLTGATAVVPMPPLAIIGKSNAGNIALLGIGDSILQGMNDTGANGLADGSNGGGYLARACYAQQTPFANLARYASKAFQFTSANTTRRAQLYQYATHALVKYGTNDISTSNNRTAAQTIAALQSIWTVLKAAGLIRVEQVTILPRTSSTDAWKTPANQTILTNYETGGSSPRDLLNVAILAAPGANGLDAIPDFCPTLEDQSNLGKWATDGTTNYLNTSDGVHLSGIATLGVATTLGTRIASWTAV